MSKCPNCGVEIDSGVTFCMECGAAIPQTKTCPKCHAQWPLNVKFCQECGYSFNSESLGPGAKLMGDKNVIAGDVSISNKTEVTNNTVNNVTNIVKNVDESAQMVRCHICGRNIKISESFDCPVCHEKTCSRCMDEGRGICKKCSENENLAAEGEYESHIRAAISNGRIELAKRAELETQRKRLHISDTRAAEIERKVTNGKADNNLLSTFERYAIEQARGAYFTDCDGKRAVALLDPIVAAHPLNEEVVTLQLEALASFDEDAAIQKIRDIKADILGATLVEIDIGLRHKDIDGAERLVDRAMQLWAGNLLLDARRVALLVAMANVTGNKELLERARSVVDAMPESKNPVERSWRYVSEYITGKSDGQHIRSKDECVRNGLCYSVLRTVIDEQASVDNLSVVGKWLDAQPEEYAKLTKDEFDEIYRIGVMGDVDAEKLLSSLYWHGCKFANSDYSQAFNWMEKAAEKGDFEAMKTIACFYCFGDGVSQDEKKAFEWMHKAAEGGYANAQNELGSYYRDGIGAQIDHVRESEWYLKAADAGNADAQNNIAWNYANGNGVEKNYELAVKYFQLGAKQGNASAMSGLAYMRFHPADGSKPDYEDAGYWYEKSAEKGHRTSQKMLSGMYFKGIGVCYDESKAVYWMEQAIANEDGDGASDDTVEKLEKELRYMKLEFEKAERSSVDELLSLFKVDGVPVDISYPKFHKLLKAANDGNDNAAYAVGVCYKMGLPNLENRDYDEALRWLTLATSQKVVKSFYALGTMFLSGEGVERDIKRAQQLFAEGAKLGCESCAGALVESVKKESPTVNAKELIILFAQKKRNINTIKCEEVTAILEYAQEVNDYSAWLYLMDCYQKGYGVAKDRVKAFECFRNVAKYSKNADSYFMVSEIWRSGGAAEIGDVKNVQEADEWLKLAIDAGSQRAKEWVEAHKQSGENDAPSKAAASKKESLPSKSTSEEKKHARVRSRTATVSATSDLKRIKFCLLGVFFGWMGAHFLYARRRWYFLVQVVCFVVGYVFAKKLMMWPWLASVLIYFWLWLVCSFFMKKDGAGAVMRWRG